MTDFVWKSRPKKPDQPSLILSLHYGEHKYIIEDAMRRVIAAPPHLSTCGKHSLRERAFLRAVRRKIKYVINASQDQKGFLYTRIPWKHWKVAPSWVHSGIIFRKNVFFLSGFGVTKRHRFLTRYPYLFRPFSHNIQILLRVIFKCFFTVPFYGLDWAFIPKFRENEAKMGARRIP